MDRAATTERSLRAFAKSLGVAHQTISKAVRRGRLRESVGRDGRGLPFIRNPALARKEWAAGRAQPAPTAKVARSRKRSSRPRPAVVLAPKRALRGADELDSLVAWQKECARERATQLRVVNQTRAGELLEREVVRRRLDAVLRTVRAQLQNIAPRTGAVVAAERDEGVCFRTIDDEIDRVCEGLADAIEGIMTGGE
jgi:hypothetical protein